MPQPKSNRSKQGQAKASGGTSKRSSSGAGQKRSGAGGTAKRSSRSGAAKSTSARRRRPGGRSPAPSPQGTAASTAQPADGSLLQNVPDVLSRGAQASLSLITLTRERIQDVVDDAVERGRMTRHDAEDLVAELVRRGRTLPPADRVLREADRARRTVGVGTSFPVLGYDDLTAAQVGDRLGTLTPPELRKVRDYERRHANRKSVLGAIEKALEK